VRLPWYSNFASDGARSPSSASHEVGAGDGTADGVDRNGVDSDAAREVWGEPGAEQEGACTCAARAAARALKALTLTFAAATAACE
jgi:hypothetical protein